MEEIFKAVPGHSDYEVSNLGRLVNLRTGNLLKGSRRKNGYVSVTMGRGNTELLHNVILKAHVGPRPTGFLGCHIDDDGWNNVLSNLVWATPKDNAAHRVKNHLIKGRDAANAKLSRDQVLDICRRLDAGEALKPIAADFGISEGAVTHINTGHVWQWLTGRSNANSRTVKLNKGVA